MNLTVIRLAALLVVCFQGSGVVAVKVKSTSGEAKHDSYASNSDCVADNTNPDVITKRVTLMLVPESEKELKNTVAVALTTSSDTIRIEDVQAHKLIKKSGCSGGESTTVEICDKTKLNKSLSETQGSGGKRPLVTHPGKNWYGVEYASFSDKTYTLETCAVLCETNPECFAAVLTSGGVCELKTESLSNGQTGLLNQGGVTVIEKHIYEPELPVYKAECECGEDGCLGVGFEFKPANSSVTIRPCGVNVTSDGNELTTNNEYPYILD